MNKKPPAGAVPSDEGVLDVLMRAWAWLGVSGRIAVLAVAAGLLLWLIIVGLRRLGRGGRRSLLWGVTGTCLVGMVGLGWWSLILPEQRGSFFVMWHQIVRVGAALCAAGFGVGFLGLATPAVFNSIERVGFVSFLAVRHVRASKSGFLTVISFLSIAGVATSACALCSVISIMGGFGADLKRKILGNNAHIKLETGNVGGFEDWRKALDQIKRIPGVATATPVAAGEAMASSSTNTAGVLVRGIDPAVDRLLPKNKKKNAELGAFLSEQRLIKDELEVAALGRFAEADFPAPDVGNRVGGHGRGEQDEGDCDGEDFHIPKYTSQLVATLLEE